MTFLSTFINNNKLIVSVNYQGLPELKRGGGREKKKNYYLEYLLFSHILSIFSVLKSVLVDQNNESETSIHILFISRLSVKF